MASSLRPGDLVVMDNLPSHKVTGALRGIESADAGGMVPAGVLAGLEPDRKNVEQSQSVAATCRMAGASKVMVLCLLADVGTLAAQYHDLTVRVTCNEVDQLWSIVGIKL